MDSCPFKPLLDLDTFAQGTPRDYINALRGAHRILWQPDAGSTGGHWLLFHHQDIDYVLRTTELFTSQFGQLVDDLPPEILNEGQKSMPFLDPPEHRNYRMLVEYAFRPGLLKEREPAMRAMAKDIIDSVIDRAECEFVNDVAIQLPMRVTFHLLGVRPEDEAFLVRLTNTLTLSDDPDFAEDRAAGHAATLQLMAFGEALAADHRANPRDNITMEVLQSELHGESLTDRQFGHFFYSLIIAGIETTRNTLAWGMYDFAHNPDQYRLLQSDLSLIPGAVEEILRFRNPVSYLRRTATQDTEVAGQAVTKGAKLVCVIASPNRDPSLFDRPDEFDIARPPAPTRRNYRTFGGGPHYCLGIHQARTNLAIMLEEIARRLDNPRVIGEPKHARAIFIDGFKELRMGFDRRP
jgi:cholest-4-en-3-one 26-monooxygenase